MEERSNKLCHGNFFLTLVSRDEARCNFQETLKVLEILIITPMSISEAVWRFNIEKN